MPQRPVYTYSALGTKYYSALKELKTKLHCLVAEQLWLQSYCGNNNSYSYHCYDCCHYYKQIWL